jgi:hypothetical protein
MRLTKLSISLLLAVFLVSAPKAAQAGSVLQTYCKHELASKKTARQVSKIIASLAVVKSTLYVILTVEAMRIANTQAVSKTARTFDILQHPMGVLVPASRSFFKAVVPSSKRLAALLDKPNSGRVRTYMMKLFTGNMRDAMADLNARSAVKSPLIVYASRGLKVMKYIDITAASILAYTGLSLAVCKTARMISPHCKASSKSNKCQMPVYDEIPSLDSSNLDSDNFQSIEPQRSCANPKLDALAARYLALTQKYASLFNKMNVASKQLNQILSTIERHTTKAASVMRGIRPVMNGVKVAMSGLKKTMYPINLAVNQIQVAMGKKICVKLKLKIGKIKKQTKKCSTPKNLVKTMKKLAKPVESAMKAATRKIFDPLIKKLMKKLPIPGVSKLESVASRMGNSLGFVGTLTASMNKLKALTGGNTLASLRRLNAELSQLNAQMKAAR